MPPEERTRSVFGDLRIRLLPELAGQARDVARLREELAGWNHQVAELAGQALKLTSQMEGERASLLTRGPWCGAALAGQDRVRALQRARLEALDAARMKALARCRAVEAELAARLGLLARTRRRLEVVEERREQARVRGQRREDDARLEVQVEDCVRRRSSKRGRPLT